MNRLKGETSPYLLQHAHNPVDWYPWGNEALERAREEGKPILVSIGYSACHWCHVMERESFEDPDVAAYMNAYFVNIKIDREERPDLDMIYMDALQALTGSGGWPLNVFLTPEAKPFYGGTYFPPKPYHNMPAWKDVLNGVLKAFMEQRDQVEDQAKELISHMERSNSLGGAARLKIDLPMEEKFTHTQLDLAFQQAMSQADKTWGGFGRAPKFPQTFTINFLLRYYHATRNKEALEHACLSLDKMIMGGIFDHVGGGFARYATDTEWLVPHFEKMLYDNALLVWVLTDAFLITGKSEYRDAIQKTLAFIEKELMNEEFAFHAALDADSEGVEGKYYVWTKQEVTDILGDQAPLFCSIYDITEEGNWEHMNIPRLKKWPADEDQELLQQCLNKLKKARASRVRPMLDDKVLLSWNALMNKAFSKAAGALGEEHYKQIAVRNMAFIEEKMSLSPDHFVHHYKNGIRGTDGFLDDYAYLIQALLGLYELTGEETYLLKSRILAEKVVGAFSDEDHIYFYFTPASQTDIIVRKKEIYDGATPSGNAVMAHMLHRLAILFDIPEWQERAIRMSEGMLDLATRYPTSFGVWTDMLVDWVYGIWEIALMGKESPDISKWLQRIYLPNKLIQIDTTKSSSFPIFKGKISEEPLSIFLCKKYSCRKPVHTLADLIQLLENEVEHKLAVAQ